MKISLLKSVAIGSLIVTSTACAAQSEQGDLEEVEVTASDPVADVMSNTKNAAAIKTIEDAYMAMRQIRAARLAIFDGSTPIAIELVNGAATNLERAISDAENVAKNSSAKIKSGYLPFDISIAISEDFVPSPEKAKKIAEANEQLKNGNQQQAVKVLRLADIEVRSSAAMLPVESTKESVTDAVNLLEEGKFYAANLALKAIEDSVTIETFDITEVPVNLEEKSKPAKSK